MPSLRTEHKGIVIFVICIGFLMQMTGSLAQTNYNPKYEFRAVWVSTAFNLDWPSNAKLSPEQQRQEFVDMLDQLQKDNVNAVFVQIRAAGDAFFESPYEPWSYWLTGKQGAPPDPFYDPLKFMVEECHKRNIEFHAWFNLFRAVSHKKFFPPVDTHITRTNPEMFYTSNNTILFDPGVPETRDYLCKIVSDVVRRYDIDGVHLDDYFYVQERGDDKINDYNTWAHYKGDYVNKGDWRRNNINMLIHQMSDSIKAAKSWVRFGISPFPVWRHLTRDSLGSDTKKSLSSYDDLYADCRIWIAESWVDYMAPQLYWSTVHPNVNYKTLFDWWGEHHYDRHIYFGHAYYKIGPDKTKDWRDPNEMGKQIRATRKSDFVKGNAFFRWASFKTNPLGAKDTLSNQYFKYPSIIPPMSWIDSIPALQPSDLHIIDTLDQLHLTWRAPPPASDGDKACYYIVYRFDRGAEVSLNQSRNILTTTRQPHFEDSSVERDTDYVYVITACDRNHNESQKFLGSWISF